MKYIFIRLTIALLTFAIGVNVTRQVNRAAHCIWPDVDPQPSTIYPAKSSCAMVHVSTDSLTAR